MLMSNGKESIVVIDNNSLQELQYKNIYIYIYIYIYLCVCVCVCVRVASFSTNVYYLEECSNRLFRVQVFSL
jgi:hypothetical protein